MEPTQRIELVRNPQEAIVNLVITGVSISIMYFTMNPTAAAKAEDWCAKQRGRIVQRLSVWMARNAIRSLPEID